MIAALLALAFQDLDALAGRLAAEDVEARVEAERAVLELPARLLPKMLEALGRRAEPEARALEERIRVNAAWIGMLPGKIREIRALADAVGQPARPERNAAVARVLGALAALPPGEAPALLLGLLDDPAEGARHFALSALRFFPPGDPAPLLPQLRDVRTSGLAAEILVAMRAESAVPLAVDLFVEEGGGMLGAARILEAFGAGAHAERIARAMREKAGLLVWGIRILRATGPAAEPQLLALAPELSYPRRREAVEALSVIGGPRSAALVREAALDSPPEDMLDLLWKLGDRETAVAALLKNARAEDLDRLSYAPLAPTLRARIRSSGPRRRLS